MLLVGRKKLDDFCGRHASVRSWVSNWLAEVESAVWRSAQDVKAMYPSASFLAGNIAIFNVKGNHYRLEIQVAYKVGVVVVRWIGTHSEYTKRTRQKP